MKTAGSSSGILYPQGRLDGIADLTDSHPQGVFLEAGFRSLFTFVILASALSILSLRFQLCFLKKKLVGVMPPPSFPRLSSLVSLTENSVHRFLNRKRSPQREVPESVHLLKVLHSWSGSDSRGVEQMSPWSGSREEQT